MNFKNGVHSLIAGFVETGENLEQAVRRELREEVNIEVEEIRYFGSQSWPHPNSLMLGFTAKAAGGELRPDGVEIDHADFYTPASNESIPTGEIAPVDGTPMDFRTPKPIGRDITQDYDALNLQGGYDHNFEVYCNPAAVLADPFSGREMAVYTDCPGVQFYSANYTDEVGKGGARYPKRSAICLETQFYPDSVNHPEWPQPITKAGQKYRSETKYRFSW